MATAIAARLSTTLDASGTISTGLPANGEARKSVTRSSTFFLASSAPGSSVAQG